MNLPYYSRVVEYNGDIAVAKVYQKSGEYHLTVDMVDGSIPVNVGTWPSLSEAMDSILSAPKTVETEIQSWKSRGYVLLVTRERNTGKHTITAAKGKIFLDTGLKFDSDVEARKAIR